MAADRGTTMKTAARFTSTSRRSRPATGGNKNLQSRARRKGPQVPSSMVARTHAGPDLGNG